MGPGHGLQLCIKRSRGGAVERTEPRQFQNLNPVPLPGTHGIHAMIEPGRVDPQPRGDIGDVTLVKIGSQEKSPCRPEIPGADQKADFS